MRWYSVRAAARELGFADKNSIRQLADRKRLEPLKLDYARTPEGEILEPRQPLISEAEIARIRAERAK